MTFSPDSRHLVFTQIAGAGNVEVVRLASTSRERTCLLENRYSPLKPKSVGFSRDGRYAVVALAENASQTREGAAPGGLLSVHRFDAVNGVIAAEALAELQDAGRSLGIAETCTFLPEIPGKPYRILVADQNADAVSAFEFDPENRTLAFTGNFAAGLSFPHGVDASADGRFVAVTSYGDDNIHIARVTHGIGGTTERSAA